LILNLFLAGLSTLSSLTNLILSYNNIHNFVGHQGSVCLCVRVCITFLPGDICSYALSQLA